MFAITSSATGLLGRSKRRQRRRCAGGERSTPGTAFRLPHPLFGTGTTGARMFRGRAVAVEDAAKRERTSYLVEDDDRHGGLWVGADAIDGSGPLGPGGPVIGYVTVRSGAQHGATRAPVAAICQACERAGRRLVEIVADRKRAPARERPGLRRALEKIAGGAARGIVLWDFDRDAGSEADLGALMSSVRRAGGDLVALNGRGSAEHRNGAKPRDGAKPRGRRAALAKRAEVARRINEMRATGMAPRAIADALNDERIPAFGADPVWRPWSVR